jgi:hypothetical protein
MFPVALDVLPVQASAVPCERLFSSSKETCTDCRNCILPKLLEALQVRKFLLKQRHAGAFDFMEGFMVKEEDYAIDGTLTLYAIEELLSLGRLDELHDLLRNAEEAVSEMSTLSFQ